MLIKVSDSIYINTDNVMSIAVERGKTIQKIKPEAMDKAQKDLTEDDYTTISADWMCFYTITANGVALEVGKDVTQEQFDAVLEAIKGLC